MTDLLSPDDVREVLRHAEEFSKPMIARLCRDYLTVLDRNKELEKLVEECRYGY